MDKDTLFIVGLIAGVMIRSFVNSRVRISFSGDLLDGKTEPDFSEEMMFDCPMCGFPAEVQSIMTQMGEGSDYMNYYILSCLGDHETAAVTEAWYRENVLDRR